MERRPASRTARRACQSAADRTEIWCSIAIRIRSAVRARPSLFFYVGAIICHGFVAEADHTSDLAQGKAFPEELENLKIAARQIFEGMR
jgi:hypothetical protein